MKIIWCLLLFGWTLNVTQASYSSDITCKAKEWLCGDQCVQFSTQCQCGSNFTSLLPDKMCCNTEPCIKHDNYTQCPDGIVQNEDERCSNMCRTTHSNFRTMWCAERGTCTKDQQVTGFCKGPQICSADDDSEFCSNVPPKADYCIKGEEKACPQVPGGDYQNRECAKESVTTVFHCLNRMDQVDVLFSPHLTKGQEINLNQLLDYNDDYFKCNQHKVNWKLKKWADVVDINDDYCLLKDQKTKIQLRSLYQKIHDDHSFERRDLAKIMGSWSFEFVLKQNCFEDPEGLFFCNEKKYTECIPKVQTCDGIPQCSNGRDEDLKLCNSTFPETATKECLKPDVYNLDIKILAVPCNRIEECSDGEDEEDCKMSVHATYAVLMAGLLVITAICVYMLYTATLEDYEEEVDFEELLREHGFDSKHTISYLTMLQSVEHQLRVQVNQRYYQEVLTHCNSKALSIIWLKDNLDAFTLDNLMSDLGDLTIFGKVKVLIIKIMRGIPMRVKFKELPMMIIKPFVHYFDVTRDIFVVIQVGYYTHSSNTFLSCVFGSLLGCLVVPFGLSSLRLLLNNVDVWKQGKKWVYNILIGLLLLPFIPVILLCYENITTLKLEHGKLAKLNTYCDQYKRIKAQTSKFIRTELGLETLLQMSFALVLLLYARSSTRTLSGLEAIFDKNAVLGMDPLVVATLGVLWGVVSTVKSYMYGIKVVKDYFPMKAMGMVGLYAIITIVIKVGVIVLFFTPALGLFDLLKHLQGESLPYNVVMKKKINTSNEYLYYSKAKPILWSEITRLDYEQSPPALPSYTLYSGYSIEEYFIIFWIIVLLHPFLIMGVKKMFNPTNFAKQSYLDRMIHAMENTQIPAPMNDWDEGPGSIKVHKERRKTVEIEIAMTILANFLVHCLMLFPLEILGK